MLTGGLTGWGLQKFANRRIRRLNKDKTVNASSPIQISRRDKIINYLLTGLSFSLELSILIPIQKFGVSLLTKAILRISCWTAVRTSFQLYFKSRMKKLRSKHFKRLLENTNNTNTFVISDEKGNLIYTPSGGGITGY